MSVRETHLPVPLFPRLLTHHLSGGALFLEQQTTAAIDGCTFDRNVAQGPGKGPVGGGGIFADGQAVLTIKDTTFRECQSDRGSAMRLNLRTQATITDSFFLSNRGLLYVVGRCGPKRLCRVQWCNCGVRPVADTTSVLRSPCEVCAAVGVLTCLLHHARCSNRGALPRIYCSPRTEENHCFSHAVIAPV